MKTVTKKELLDAAAASGFTDEDYGLMSHTGQSEFDKKIGVEEYACGDRILRLLAKLGIEVTDD